MKNDSHPLMQALKSKSKGGVSETPIQAFDMPRHFEIKHDEIPGLAGRKVGEKITVGLEGHIHSQHHDGHAIVQVSSVKPDSEEMKAKENPDTTSGESNEY